MLLLHSVRFECFYFFFPLFSLREFRPKTAEVSLLLNCMFDRCVVRFISSVVIVCAPGVPLQDSNNFFSFRISLQCIWPQPFYLVAPHHQRSESIQHRSPVCQCVPMVIQMPHVILFLSPDARMGSRTRKSNVCNVIRYFSVKLKIIVRAKSNRDDAFNILWISVFSMEM